jgi:hypothetical protein
MGCVGEEDAGGTGGAVVERSSGDGAWAGVCAERASPFVYCTCVFAVLFWQLESSSTVVVQ